MNTVGISFRIVSGPRLPRYNPWLKRITVFSVVLILLDVVVLRSGRGYWLYVLLYAAYYAAGVLSCGRARSRPGSTWWPIWWWPSASFF